MMVENQILQKLDAIEKKIDRYNQKNWLDMNGVVKYTSLSKSKINRLVSQGRLRVSKSTGKNLFKKEWIDTFLEGK